MLIFDIVVALLLLYALYKGFTKGFFVQLAGLAGLLIGAWVAMRSGTTLGLWLGIDAKYAGVAGFLIILILVILLVALVGRFFKKVFGFAGLSLLDKLAGVVMSLAKTWLIAGLLIWGFDSMNRVHGWVDRDKLGGSVFYKPLVDVTSTVFPYLESLKDTFSPLWNDSPDNQNDGQDA